MTTYREPAGPGVRVDSGIGPNSVIGGAFDSLLAKLIVWGESRQEALARSRRALDEFVVDGMATALPFHRAVVRDPAFTSEPFTVFTQWIETEFDNQLPAFAARRRAVGLEPVLRETIVVEVNGRRLAVTVPGDLRSAGSARQVAAGAAAKRSAKGRSHTAATGDELIAPMQGTVVKVAVADGDMVQAGDLVVMIEAMKMEQPLNAHRAGTIAGLTATDGQTIKSGETICRIVDDSAAGQ